MPLSVEELSLYAEQRKALDAELAKIASKDEDCKLLMTIPGVGPFVAVAIKARIGDIKRFPDKQKLASYAGLVPKADNSGERVSKHDRLKHGDNVLKEAFTIAARGAVSVKSKNSIKQRYLKMLRKRKVPQDAEVIAGKKVAYIVWSILTNRKPYIEEDKYLTVKKQEKLKQMQSKDHEVDRETVLEKLKNSYSTIKGIKADG